MLAKSASIETSSCTVARSHRALFKQFSLLRFASAIWASRWVLLGYVNLKKAYLVTLVAGAVACVDVGVLF